MPLPKSFEEAELAYPDIVAAKAQLAAPDLIAALEDGRGVVRANALLGLAAIGHPGRELSLYLRDADARVARAAAEAVVQLGLAQKAQLPAIAATLDEARPEIVAAIVRMFAALIGHADGELIGLLDTSSAGAAEAVIGACTQIGVRGLHLLHAAARDPRARVRLHAVRGIGQLGVLEQPASFEVLAHVETTDDVSDVQAAARTAAATLKVRCILKASAKRKSGEPVVPLVPALEQRVMTPAEVQAATKLAPLDELLLLLDAAPVHTRLNAVRVIVGLGAPGAITALAGRLRDDDASVRLEVAQALGKLGDPARVAAPSLVAALDDRDPQVVASAEASLAAMGEAIAPALVDGLDTPSEALGLRVAALLGLLPEGARLLQTALSFLSIEVRIHAALGLAALGRERAGHAMPALAAANSSGNARLRAAIEKAKAVVAPRPDRNPPPIAVPGFETRPLTAAELEGAKSVGALGLAAHLNDPRVVVRTNIATALGGLGADAAPALAIALRDHAPEVRLAAAASVGDPTVLALADDLVRALGDDALAAPIAALLRGRKDAGIDAALARGLDGASPKHAQRICELIVARPSGVEILCGAFARPGAQANAAAGFVRLGKDRIGAGRAVLEAARTDSSSSTRDLAVTTLRAIDGVATGPVVPAIAGFETTPLEASAFKGGPSADALLPFLQDGRSVVRANAAIGIGALGPAAAGLALSLAPLLRDEDTRVRVAVASALDKLGDDAVIAAAPALVEALRGDPVVYAACKAVLLARAAKVEAALVAGLETPDETHGLRIAELICTLPNAPQLLFRAYDGPAQNSQINAALGIGLLGSKRAGADGRLRLKNGLAGPITARRHAVVKALSLLGPE